MYNMFFLFPFIFYFFLLYVVFEHILLQYRSLHKKVKIEDIAAERAWLCFRQIVEGVAYIHSKGVVHLDLTLKNILVDERWTIKITDFGLGK